MKTVKLGSLWWTFNCEKCGALIRYTRCSFCNHVNPPEPAPEVSQPEPEVKP